MLAVVCTVGECSSVEILLFSVIFPASYTKGTDQSFLRLGGHPGNGWMLSDQSLPPLSRARFLPKLALAKTDDVDILGVVLIYGAYRGYTRFEHPLSISTSSRL